MRLKTKMLSMILLPVVLLTGILSIYTYYHSKEDLETQILETNRFRVQYFDQVIDGMLNGDEMRMKQLALDLADSGAAFGEAVTKNFVDAGSSANMQFTIVFETGEQFCNVPLPSGMMVGHAAGIRKQRRAMMYSIPIFIKTLPAAV